MYRQGMKTTVDIPDHLLVEAEKLAAERRLPVTRLFEESLREYLAAQRRSRSEPLPPLPSYSHVRPAASVDFDDTSRL
jgi:hypothetical protein